MKTERIFKMDEYVYLVGILFLVCAAVTILIFFRNSITDCMEQAEADIEALFLQEEESVETVEKDVVNESVYFNKETEQESCTYTTETIAQPSIPKENVSITTSSGVVAIVITLAVLFFVYRMTKLVGNYILSWIMITKEEA